MDEEQVKALIAAALGDFKTEIGATIDSKNAGLAANLTREIKKLATPAPEKPADPPADPQPKTEAETEGKLTLKALQAQLQEQTKLISSLKEEGDRKERETQAAKRKSALAGAIAEAKTINPTLLQKVLDLEYGENVKEENGGWFVAKGDSVQTLRSAIEGYLSTEEGKAFLPASGTQGAGSVESTTVTPMDTGTVDLNSALMSAF